MLTDVQLDDVKAKLESGKNLREIIKDDYDGEPVMKVRNSLIEKFGRPTVQQLLMTAQLAKLSIEKLNERIEVIESRLNKIKAIRDAKL